MQLLPIESLLQQGIFRIPSYQRGYSWQHKQVQDLLDDLYETKELKEHYTGSITVVEKGTRSIFPKTFKIYEVVDGQQRLTTFTILIHCIYNRLKKLELKSDELDDIHKNIVYRDETLLKLHDDSQAYYASIITMKIPSTASLKAENKSQLNLSSARKQISKYLDSYKLEQVMELYATLMNKFKINFYILSKESDVGVVFETMNTRGLPLTKMDMVKNYLVYLASRLDNESLAEKINQYFGIIFKNLMLANASFKQEDEILRYSYVIIKGALGDDIYLDIKDYLKKGSSYDEILNYVEFLKNISFVYTQILNQDFKNETINNLLCKILWLGTESNFLPLLLSIFLKWGSREKDIVIILRLIESYSFRVYKIAGKQVRTGKSELYSSAYQVYNGTLTLQGLAKIFVNLKYFTDKALKENLSFQLFYDSQESNKIAYFFYEYEQYLHNTINASSELLSFKKFVEIVNNKTLTVEHIFPQKSQSGNTLDGVDKLGNLTITCQNSTLSNKEFHNKKELYQGSDFLVENVLATIPTWGDEQINDRTKELINFAQKRWKIKYS